MSRRQGAVAGGAGAGLAVGSVYSGITRYLCVTFGKCRIAKIVEVWHGEVWVAAFRRRGRRYVAVVELVGGEWPEVVAEFDAHTTWGRAKRVMERLVEQCGVCDDFTQYDVCKQEESGRAAEIVMGLLGDP